MALITDKLIFIHVQKTGGMAIRKALQLADPNCRESGDYATHRHIGYPELLAEQPAINAGRKAMACVRHPISWLRSRWAFAKQTGFATQIKHNPRAAAIWLADVWDEDFNRYIDKILERRKGIATAHQMHMIGWWTDTPVNLIVRHETLSSDLQAAFDYMGMGEVGLEVVNPTRAVDSGAARLTPTQHSQLLELEAGCINAFFTDNYDLYR